MKIPKMLKVMYNGEYLCNIYPHATRFQVFKYRLAKLMRKVLIASFLVGLVYGSFQLGRTTTEPIFVNAEDKSQAMFDAKIEALKDGVVEKLMSCESAGYKEDDGIIIFDTNNKASIGQAQWQTASLKYYYKLAYGKDITTKEAVMIALDKKQAGELVKYVAFETKNKLSKDWYNCEKKFGLDKEIDLIKQLESI